MIMRWYRNAFVRYMNFGFWCAWISHPKCTVWVYTYTHGTHLIPSREPRGDPAENPIEHPVWTWRPPGPLDPNVHYQPLLRQLCTASENTGEAIFMQVWLTPPPRPPSERANVPTYSGASQGYSYVHGTVVNTCTGDLCYAEVGFSTIMYYVLEQQASEKTNALSLRALTERQTRIQPVLPVPGNMKLRKVLWCLRKICNVNVFKLAPC